jgi:DNA modification methylase
MMQPYYEHNGIAIYHGDCREILPTLRAELADLVITDPPYGVAYMGGTVEREALEGDMTPDLYPAAMRLLRRIVKPIAALYLFYADGHALTVRAGVLSAGFEIRTTIIWNKQLAQYGCLTAQYKQKHEPLLYCHVKGSAPKWCGPTNEVTVWDCDRAIANAFHPTQKPVGLLMRAMRNSSESGDLVLDPFMGSGTTLVAAKMLGRSAIGVEVAEQYCEIAAKRLQQEVFDFDAVSDETEREARLLSLPARGQRDAQLECFADSDGVHSVFE